jgi:hypothetical protein
MSSRKLTRSIAVGIAAIAIGGGTYGSSAQPRAAAHPLPAAARPLRAPAPAAVRDPAPGAVRSQGDQLARSAAYPRRASR